MFDVRQGNAVRGLSPDFPQLHLGGRPASVKKCGTIVGRNGPVHFPDGLADFLLDLLFADNSGVVRPLFLTAVEKKTRKKAPTGNPCAPMNQGFSTSGRRLFTAGPIAT